jgi:hypothetical protein
MTSLQISLLAFGGLTLAAVIGYNVWTSRKMHLVKLTLSSKLSQTNYWKMRTQAPWNL